MAGSRSAFAELSRAQLAILVPELLLAGHLIDRAGLGHVLAAFGPDGMRDVAIEEWAGASPVYTRRMQRAMGFAGDDVITIFKGLQLDIGAPPQFMDFRFIVHDRNNGEFELAHCGALMDVEPMGESFVRRMCHDIEDPTFDATAAATNPYATVRPVHRPPRVPADRTPHCRWTVTIDEAGTPVAEPPRTRQLSGSEAARFVAGEIDPAEPGAGDYRGPLLSDLAFADFSSSALVRLAEEVCVQGHLLVLSFALALRARTDEDSVRDMVRHQLTGIAGVAAERIRAALQLPADLSGAATLLRIHPALNPAGYVDLSVLATGDALELHLGRHAGADADGAWPSLIDGAHLDPIRAIVRAVDPRLTVRLLSEDEHGLRLAVHTGEQLQPELPEVQLTRISTGSSFVFDDRGRGLPLTVLTH